MTKVVKVSNLNNFPVKETISNLAKRPTYSEYPLTDISDEIIHIMNTMGFSNIDGSWFGNDVMISQDDMLASIWIAFEKVKKNWL